MAPYACAYKGKEKVAFTSSDLPLRSRPETTRPASRASSASSHTMRAEDSDIEEVPPNEFGFYHDLRARAKRPRHEENHKTSASLHAFNHEQLAARSSGKKVSIESHAREAEHAADIRESMPNRKRALSPGDLRTSRNESDPSSRSSSRGQQTASRRSVREANEYMRQHPESRVEDGRVLINLDAMEERMEEEIKEEVNNAKSRPAAKPRKKVFKIELPWVKEDSVRYKDWTVKPGKTVELQSGGFLYIVDVIKNLETDVVKLRGWQMKRCSSLDGLLRKALNELCFIFEQELDDPRSMQEQSMMEAELGNILKVREVIRTNYPFPFLRFEDPAIVGDEKENVRFARDNDRLVCRWKYIIKYANHAERLRVLKYPLNVVEKRLETFNEDECTAGYHLDPMVRRFLWRGETTLGGSGLKHQNFNHRASEESKSQERPSQSVPLASLEFCPICGDSFHEVEMLFQHWQESHQEYIRQSTSSHSRRRSQSHRKPSFPQATSSTAHKSSEVEVEALRGHLATNLSLEPEVNVHNQIYTYGDTFCGAGGTTRGALMAGLLIKWGLDMDKDAGHTWRKNFPTARHYQKWASDFVVLPDELKQFIVDVLHLSPPCQVWSPVHVVPGKNDRQNFDSLFACEELLKKARPRIVTLEQTFGILHPKFSDAFNTLIQMFTFYGYSVSWRLVEFQRWGLAQQRRRLIIVAAGPGETIPEFPRYTHSNDPTSGLKPYTTVNSVLSSIPPNAPNHDVAFMLSQRTFKAAWDGNRIVNCITCDGGGMGHPSGLRNFTIRELASLQSFPLDHIFYGGQIRKQVGNAVPPLIAKIIYRAIIKHLEKVDGVVRQVHVLD